MVLAVASIDFGTAYSGWAFLWNYQFKSDPTKATSKTWTGGKLVSEKGPTCVLIKKDGETLDSFGFEAENNYGQLTTEDSHKEYYFFKKFKMLLYTTKDLGSNFKIEDATGKELPAKRVFSLSIKYLKNDFLATLNAKGDITERDVKWVLTVPAIWTDAAKQFMREAAEEAGIDGRRLSLALEPEAASLYCRLVPIDKLHNADLRSFQPGTIYMILDAGGGTVDITVHEVLPGGKLKELHKASGGYWGGTKVDDAFEALIEEMTCSGIIEKFKRENTEDYIDMCREFELKKREMKPDATSKVTVRIPVGLMEVAEEMTDKSFKKLLLSSKHASKCELKADKIRIDANLFLTLFKEPVSKLLDHVETLLNHKSVVGCKTILMVGGFSDSAVLQKRVADRFEDKRVIVPSDAGVAVLKGAAIFGHSPSTIAERVCKLTYGAETTHEYKSSCSHKKGKCEPDENGDMRCFDIFDIHVRAGQSVALGHEQRERIYKPISEDQTEMGIDIYASITESPELVTEPGCSKIGSLTVPIQGTRQSGRSCRKFGVRFLFGGTEIEVKVTDKANGKEYFTRADFLG